MSFSGSLSVNFFRIAHNLFISTSSKLRFGRDVGHVLQDYLERFAKWPLKPPFRCDLNLLPCCESDDSLGKAGRPRGYTGELSMIPFHSIPLFLFIDEVS